MDSAPSDSDDTAFLPATASPGPVPRKRQRSVGEMMRRLENKKKRIVSPKEKGKVSTHPEFMEELSKMIKSCIEESNTTLWQKVENKISSYEAKIEKLEGDIFDRDMKIDSLETELRGCQDSLQKCQDQLDEMERHSRLVNLVLSSQRFGRRQEGEDIAKITVDMINGNYPDVRVSKNDFTVIHRLGKNNTVICAFKSMELRNTIYEGRLRMRYQATFSNRLFVSENLTRANNAIFKRLVDLNRSGKLWTVFSKAGIPSYKASKTSTPIRVYNMQQLIALESELTAATPAPAPAPERARAGPERARLLPRDRPRSPPGARPEPPLAGHAGRSGEGSAVPQSEKGEIGGQSPSASRPEVTNARRTGDTSSRRSGAEVVSTRRRSRSAEPRSGTSEASRPEVSAELDSPPPAASASTSAASPVGEPGAVSSLGAPTSGASTEEPITASVPVGDTTMTGTV